MRIRDIVLRILTSPTERRSVTIDLLLLIVFFVLWAIALCQWS